MAHDFEIEPGLSVGEWLHDEIVRTLIIEREPWALERVGGAAARLQVGRPESEQLVVVIPWVSARTAFTAPGRYIYLTRGLLERLPDDHSAAFVIAHEIAHHDLGHLQLIPEWIPRFVVARGGGLAVVAMAGLERRIYGPERECDADRYAIDLCIEAGYDAEKCLNFFYIMELIALDAGDDDIVFGPDPDSDGELLPDAPWLTKARIWAWQRTRGYLPLRDRAGAIRAHLAARGAPVRRPA